MRNADAWQKRKRPEPSSTVTLDGRLEVPVTAEAAWSHLQDVDAIAVCIPGLVPGSVERTSPTTVRGRMKHLALGVPSTWQLTAEIGHTESDRTLDIRLEGVEERLDLKLSGEARLSVAEGDPTHLDYAGSVTVRGRLAGAGGPIIERVVASIIERFVERLGAAGATPVRRGRWRRLWDRLRGRG